jgi:hypothetical protein
MKWSFKLGHVLGIGGYIHFAFLLLLGFVGLGHWLPGAQPRSGAVAKVLRRQQANQLAPELCNSPALTL